MIKIFFPWISILDLYSKTTLLYPDSAYSYLDWWYYSSLSVDWTDERTKCRLFIKTLTCRIAKHSNNNLRLNLTFAFSRFLGTKHCNFKNTKTCATLAGDERNPTRVFLNLLPIVLMNGGSTIIHIIQIAKKDMCHKTWSIMSHSNAIRIDRQYLLIGSVKVTRPSFF